jgi:cell division GTPase FtsZ
VPAFRWMNNYRESFREDLGVISALRQAEHNLSLSVNIEDARKILVMIGAPKSAITTSTMEEMTKYFNEKSPKATLRIGDYPRRQNEISVTLIASQLTKVEKLESIYQRAEVMFAQRRQIEEETELQIEKLLLSGSKIPTLE